jgi:hypothetical protein
VEEEICVGFSTAGSWQASFFTHFGAEEFVQNPLEFAHHRFTELRSLLGYATPRLLADIEGTTELVDKDRDWSIYRILPPPR